MSVVEDTYSDIIPRFNGEGDDYFHLWYLNKKAALKDKKIVHVFPANGVCTDITDDELS